MPALPLVLQLFAAIAALIWAGILAWHFRPGSGKAAKLLSLTVWSAALFGSALTLVRHTGTMGSLASTLLMAGTFIVIFGFMVSAIAGAPKRAPNQGLVLLAVAITVTELIYLLAHSDGISENLPEVLALSFLPGIVIQVRSSGASKQHILRLAAHISAFVVWVSVILGFVAPSLAYGQGFSDHRRIPILGLTMRLEGVTPHPNFLAVTAVICIVLAWAVKLRHRTLTIIVALVAIGMAESRNALLTLAVVAVVAWACSGKSIIARLLLVSPLAVPLVLFGTEFEGGGNALTSDIENNGRYRVWDMILAGFQNDPLSGWGPLAFQEESGSPLLSAGLQHAHNQVLQSIAEGGLVGGALMVVLLLVLVQIALKHRYEAVYPSIVTICLMGIATEPYLTMHLYGLNYAVVPAFLMLAVMMSADAPGDPARPIQSPEKRSKVRPRKDLPEHLANPSDETRQLLGLSKGDD